MAPASVQPEVAQTRPSGMGSTMMQDRPSGARAPRPLPGRPAADVDAAGWHDGLAALYGQRWAPMVRLATMMVGSQAVAEDLVQDAFVRVHDRWETAREPAAYLRTAVVNGCRSWLRRKALERRLPVPPVRDVAAPSLPDDDLWRRVGRLSPNRRVAIVLRFYEDLSVEQTAAVMGCRPGTVKSLTSRAVAQLREQLS